MAEISSLLQTLKCLEQSVAVAVESNRRRNYDATNLQAMDSVIQSLADLLELSKQVERSEKSLSEILEIDIERLKLERIRNALVSWQDCMTEDQESADVTLF